MDRLYHTPQQLPLFALTKCCPDCKKVLPAEAFNSDRSNAKGLSCYCKECTHRRDRARHNTDEARAKRRERNRPKIEARRIQRELEKQNQPPPPPITHKLCPVCDPPVPKPVSEFGKCKSRKDGLNPYCKECASKKAHARLDRRREYERERRQDPEFMQTKREKHTEWRNKNIERRREQDRTRYAEDPEYREMMRKSNLKWQNAHPIKRREYHMRRKSKMVGTEIDPVDYEAILARDGWVCHICGKSIDPNAKKRSSRSLTFDHVIPLIPRPGEPQGTHCQENLKVAHMGCNVRKGNRPLETLTPYDRRGVK